MNVILVVTFVICIAYMLRTLFTVYRVRGRSMLPELHDGAHVVVLRFRFLAHVKKRSIVVIGSSKEHNFTLTGDYVKRVTGVPGDLMPTKYKVCAFDEDNKPNSTEIYFQKKVPPKHIYVESDNKESIVFDSSLWGAIPIESVKGIVVLKLVK